MRISRGRKERDATTYEKTNIKNKHFVKPSINEETGKPELVKVEFQTHTAVLGDCPRKQRQLEKR